MADNINGDSFAILNNILNRELHNKPDPLLEAANQATQANQAYQQNKAVAEQQQFTQNVQEQIAFHEKANAKAERLNQKLAATNAADKYQKANELTLIRDHGLQNYLSSEDVGNQSYYSPDERLALAQSVQEEERQNVRNRYAPKGNEDIASDIAKSGAAGLLDLAGTMGGLATGAVTGIGDLVSDDVETTFDNPFSKFMFDTAEDVRGGLNARTLQAQDDTQLGYDLNEAKVDYLKTVGVEVPFVEQVFNDMGVAATGMTMQTFVNLLAEEIPSMLAGGVSGAMATAAVKDIGKNVVKKASKQLDDAASTAQLNKAEAALKAAQKTQKSADKVSGAVGTAVTAAELGAQEVLPEVQREYDLLEDMGGKAYVEQYDILSENYAKYLQDNQVLDSDANAKKFALDQIAKTAAKQGAGAALVSKLTGTASGLRKAATPKATTGFAGSAKGVAGTVVGTTKEATEEGLTQTLMNQVEKTERDSTVKTSKGVGQSIVEGGAVGGTLGTAPKAVSAVASGLTAASEAQGKRKAKALNQKLDEASSSDEGVTPEAKAEYKASLKLDSEKSFSKVVGTDAAALAEVRTKLKENNIELTDAEEGVIQSVEASLNERGAKYAEKEGKAIAEEGAADLPADKTGILASGAVASTKLTSTESKATLNAVSESIMGTRVADDSADDAPEVLGSSPESVKQIEAAKTANSDLIDARDNATSNEFNAAGKQNLEGVHAEVNTDIASWTGVAAEGMVSNSVTQVEHVVQSANDLIQNKKVRLASHKDKKGYASRAEVDSALKTINNPKATPTEVNNAVETLANKSGNSPRFIKAVAAEIAYAESLKTYIGKNAALASSPEMQNIDLEQSTDFKAKDATQAAKPSRYKLTKGYADVKTKTAGTRKVLKALNKPTLSKAVKDANLDLSDATIATMNNLEDAPKEDLNAALTEIDEAIAGLGLRDSDNDRIQNAAGFIQENDATALDNIQDKDIEDFNVEADLDESISKAQGKAYSGHNNVDLEEVGSLTASELKEGILLFTEQLTLSELESTAKDEAIAEAEALTAFATKPVLEAVYTKLANVINDAKVDNTALKEGTPVPISLTPRINVTRGMLSKSSAVAQKLFKTSSKYLSNTIKGIFANKVGGVSFKDGTSNQFKAITNGLTTKQQEAVSTLLKKVSVSVNNMIRGTKKGDFRNSISSIEEELGRPNNILGSLLFKQNKDGKLVEGDITGFMEQVGISLIGALTSGVLSPDSNRILRALLKSANISSTGNETDEELRNKVSKGLMGKLGTDLVASHLREDLGKEVLKSMGLEINPETADTALNDHLTDAVGNIALEMLKDLGVVKHGSIAVKKDSKTGTAVLNTSKANNVPFTALAKVDMEHDILTLIRDNDLNKFFQMFTGSNKNTQGIITEAPTQEELRNRSGGELSQEHQDALNNSFNSARTLFNEMATTLVKTFKTAPETFYEMLGIDATEVLTLQEDSVQAVKDDIDKVMAIIEQAISDPDKYKEIYQSFVLGRNIRLTEVSGLSPQANKIVRALMSAHSDSITAVDSKTDMLNFKFALSRSFEEGKLDMAEAEAWYDNLFGNEVDPDNLTENQRIAYAAYLSINAGTSIHDDGELLNLMHKGEAKMVTLQGIYSVGAYINAVKEGKSSFVNQLAREDDGIANGVYYLLTQFGNFGSATELKESMIQVGVSTGDNPDVIHLRGKKTFTDVYQTLGKGVLTDLEPIIRTARENAATTDTGVLSLFDTVFNSNTLTKVIRNIMKYPLMTYIYGAGEGSIRSTILDDFTDLMLKEVSSVQSEIIKEAKLLGSKAPNYISSPEVKAKLADLADRLTGLGKVKSISPTGAIEYLPDAEAPIFKITLDKVSHKLKIEVSEAVTYTTQKTVGKGKGSRKVNETKTKRVTREITERSTLLGIFKDGVNALISDSAIKSIDAKYAKVSAVANTFSSMVNLQSQMYVQDYNERVESIIFAKPAGERFLTQAEHTKLIEELADIYPAIATFLTPKKDGKYSDFSGLHITKQEFTRNTDNAESQTVMLTPTAKGGTSKVTSTAATTMAHTNTQANPFIGHNLDASVIAKVLLEQPDIVQVYDGLVQDPNSFAATHTANKAAVESIEGYSPLDAARFSLEESIKRRAAKGYNPTVATASVTMPKSIFNAMFKSEDGQRAPKLELTPTQMVSLMDALAKATNAAKTDLMKVARIINQYGDGTGGIENVSARTDLTALEDAALSSEVAYSILESLWVNSLSTGSNTVTDGELEALLSPSLDERKEAIIKNKANYDMETLHRKLYEMDVKTGRGDNVTNIYVDGVPTNFDLTAILSQAVSGFQMAGILENNKAFTSSKKTIAEKQKLIFATINKTLNNLKGTKGEYLLNDLWAVSTFLTKYGSDYLMKREPSLVITPAEVLKIYATEPSLKGQLTKALKTTKQGKAVTEANVEEAATEILGSSPESLNGIDMTHAMASGEVVNLDMNEVGAQVEAADPNNHLISSDHSNMLGGLLTKLTTLYNRTATALKVEVAQADSKGNSLGTISANQSIRVSVASKKANKRNATTAKEALVHEMVHPIWAWALNPRENGHANVGFRKELNGIIQDLIKSIGGTSNGYKIFLQGIPNPTAAEIKQAKELAEYTLGNMKHSPDEFAAYAMTNEMFSKALSQHYRSKAKPADTFVGKVNELFNKILNHLFGRAYVATNTGARLDKSIEALFNDIEKAFVEHKAGVKEQAQRNLSAQGGIQGAFDKTDNILLQGVSSVVGALSGTSGNLLSDTVEAYKDKSPERIRAAGMKLRETMNKISGNTPLEVRDIVTQVFGEAKSLVKANQSISRATAMVDAASNKIKTALHRELSRLVPEGEEFNDIRGSAIRNGLLKADVPALLKNGFTMAQVTEMYSDPTKLKAAQTKLLNQVGLLHSQNIASTVFHVAKAHGGFQVSGKTKYGTFMQNPRIAARQIAHQFKLDDSKEETFINLIDQLMSLGTIAETHVTGQNVTIHRDLTKPNMNQYYTSLITAAEENHRNSIEAFEGSEKIMVKGYIQDVTNPNISLVTAPLTERRQYEEDGFKLVKTLPTPNGKHVGMFVRNYGGSKYASTAALKRSSNSSAGVGIVNTLQLPKDALDTSGYLGAIAANKKLEQDLALELKSYYDGKPRTNVDAVKFNMVPVPSQNGTVYQFRSMPIDEAFKRDHLGLYNDPSTSIANSMGVIAYKLESPRSNAEIINELHKTYLEEYSEYPNSFIEIDPNNLKDAKNKRFARAFTAMDSKSRDLLIDSFGKGNKIYVKRNQYTQVFGFDRFSISDIASGKYPEVDGYKKAIDLMQKAITPFVSNRFVKAAEYYHQEYVKEILKAIVVKTGTVTLGNMIGNFSLTLMMGMNPVTTTKDLSEGIVLGKQFITLLEKRDDIRAKIVSTPTDNTVRMAKLDKALAIVEGEMKSSPMYDLYREGHINHVITDPSNDITNLGTTKSKIREGFNQYFHDKVPAGMSQVAKEFVATEDSIIYSFMQQSVMMSDLGFKYAYKKHLQNTGTSLEEAMHKVGYVFLNYDAPSSKGIDYLESLGIVMFSKFTLRFQRVLLNNMAMSPSRTIAVNALMGNLFPAFNIADTSLATGKDLADMFHMPFDNYLTPLKEMPIFKFLGVFF